MAKEPFEVYPLAIVVPGVGEPYQTFIQRHVNWLLPGKTVVLTAERGKFWTPEPPTHDLNIFNRDNLKAICELLQRHRVKVILGEFLDQSLLWCKLANLLGIKFYVHGHGYDISEMLSPEHNPSRYLAYKDVDGIITVNHQSAERLIALGLPEERIHVVPYGIPVPDVVAAPGAEGDNNVKVLAVGRMVDKKAPVLVLDAFRRAVADYPQLHLDYVGDGVLFESAVNAAKAFGIEDKVTFHGLCDNAKVVELLKQADIFMQHSVKTRSGDEEGLPVSIIEAMAYKLPVVSTRHSAIVEEVIDGHNGFLVDEFDTVGMAAKLVELAKNPAQCVAFGAAGQQHYLKNYTWDQERVRLMQIMDLESWA